jgi:hypothetical protein
MTTDALRVDAASFDATVNGRVAAPGPLAVPWIAIHATLTDAFQEHSRSVSILIVALPPVDPNVDDEAVGATAHFATPLGPTTVVDVDVEDEHAVIADAISTNATHRQATHGAEATRLPYGTATRRECDGTYVHQIGLTIAWCKACVAVVNIRVAAFRSRRRKETFSMRWTRLIAVTGVLPPLCILLSILDQSPRATAQEQETAAVQQSSTATSLADASTTASIVDHATKTIRTGRKIFRFDTFGDESFWGGALKLHRAIEGAKLGGIGPGLSPRNALALGLKVDSRALPPDVADAIRSGKLNLDDPANTLALLKLNAVVGLTGFFHSNGVFRSVGIQCALCHSMVDDSFAPGIGRRLDGWANRDLNVGAIVALAPDLRPLTQLLGVSDSTVRHVLRSWGPGKFDAELILDGKAFQPNGRSAATLIPPAFGLAGVNLHTWTGWGSVTHWNAFVSNLEMHGKGFFFDPRLDDSAQFPIAAANGFGHVSNEPDLITAKLAPLHFYQLALAAPTPPAGAFDRAAAARGDELFSGKAKCSSCHVEPLWTEPGWNLHKPGEIGLDAFQANRAPDRAYRTSPLAGLWTHTNDARRAIGLLPVRQGGFFHDGRFATLLDVINHYNRVFQLGLTDQEKRDLVEYLKSL